MVEGEVEPWKKYERVSKNDSENISGLGAAVISRIAVLLVWDGASVTRWKDLEDNAMQRLAPVWKTYSGSDDDPEAAKELNMALDALAVAHIAATFAWSSGLLK
jgi:hypothetical protein